jgi:hypothetical protein
MQSKPVVAATLCCTEAWYVVRTAVAEAISGRLEKKNVLNIKNYLILKVFITSLKVNVQHKSLLTCT